MLSDQLVERFQKLVGVENVLFHPAELLVYECDGLTFHRHPPDLVLFPRSALQVQEIVQLARCEKIPFLARGAGTSLSGSAIPIRGGILLEMARMNRILEINPTDRYAVVEPGVINLELSERTKAYGLHFAPDPSSQGSCTVGGNIGCNAGGPHCLKHGSTVQHVLAVEVVTPEAELVQFGTPQGFHPGYDLTGLFTGSEGTFGILTKAWLRLTPLPESTRTFLAAFERLAEATRAVSRIIAAGMIPAALEMMDQLTIQAVENSVYAAGYPTDAAAVLLVEVDGFKAEAEAAAGALARILEESGAVQIREARDELEREKLWAGRKKAFGAFGRIARDLYLQDTVVPRSKLTEVLERIYEIAHKYELPVVNVFHAGDGNLHPVLLYDAGVEEQTQRVLQASREMIKVSVQAGGTLTGEHGVGLEKRDFMPFIFSEEDLEPMRRLRHLFDPEQLCNPEKLLPSTKVCMEFRESRIP